MFYANYLKFFERARTEWLRSLGFEQQSMRMQDGVMFIVSHTDVRYLKPARLDDLLQISVEPRDIGRASMNLFQQARCGERLLAEGQIRIGCVQSSSQLDFKPNRLPAALMAALQAKQP